MPFVQLHEFEMLNSLSALSPQIPKLPRYGTEGVSAPRLSASCHRPSLHWATVFDFLCVHHRDQHTPLETLTQQSLTAAIECADPTLVRRLSHHATCVKLYRTVRTTRQAPSPTSTRSSEAHPNSHKSGPSNKRGSTIQPSARVTYLPLHSTCSCVLHSRHESLDRLPHCASVIGSER